MKRRWVGLALSVCAIAAAVAIGSRLVSERVSLEWLRPVLERELSEALGLDVELGSVPRIVFTPELELSVENVRVANLPGRASPSLLAVDRLTLEPRILPLLQERLVIDTLELSGVTLRIEPDAQGAWSLRPELDELDEVDDAADEGDPFALLIRQLTVSELEVFFDRDGETDVTTLTVERLAVRTEDRTSPLRIEARGAYEGSDFAIEADLGSLAELLEPSGTFPVSLRASLSEGRLEAEGNLGDPRTLAGAELQVRVEIADLASGAGILGLELPSLGTVEGVGVLVDREGVLGLEAISARSGSGGPLELEIEGAIRDLAELEGVDLRMRVAAPDVDFLKSVTTLSLPGVPLRATIDVDDEDGSLGVEGAGQVARPGVFEVAVEGGFGDLRGLKDLDVRIAFQTKTLDALFDAYARNLSWRLPDLGPLEATGSLVLLDGRLGLEEVDVRLGDPALVAARLRGTVADIFAIRGVDLEARVHSEHARVVAALFEREIPEIGGLDASFRMRDDDGSLGIESATLTVGGEGPFALRLSGVFDDLRDLEELVFETSLKARDLAILGELAEIELPTVGPVAFSGEIRGGLASLAARGQLELSHSMIRGELWSEKKPGQRPAATLRIEAPRLHLPDLVAARPAAEVSPLDRGSAGFDLGRWWRGRDALPLDVLHAVDVEFSLEADRVTGEALLDLSELRVAGRLFDGRLRVDEIRADYEQGKVSGAFELDARPVSPVASLALEAFNVDLTRLMSQFQADTEYAGMLDLSIRLDTTGDTAPEVRENLHGVLGVMLREGAIVNEYSKALTFDILRVSVPSFGSAPRNEAPVQCLLALVPVGDGVAELETFYLEGGKITILGEGTLDLGTEELDLRFTPQVHDPGLVSIAATVEVSGPIGDPVVRPIRQSMVTSALRAVYRNALRPLKAVDRMLRRRDSKQGGEAGSPCGLVARQRVTQMTTDEVEPIDLESALEGQGAASTIAPVERESR